MPQRNFGNMQRSATERQKFRKIQRPKLCGAAWKNEDFCAPNWRKRTINQQREFEREEWRRSDILMGRSTSTVSQRDPKNPVHAA